MNRTPVFLSFDYEHDLATKNRLVAEWAGEQCPIWIKDVSLPGAVTDHRWQADAAKAIDSAKAVLVICGKNTHSAKGVIAEVQMAIQRHKPIVYLQAFKYGSSLPHGVAHDTSMIGLDWKAVHAAIAPLGNQ
ncbi:MAG: toll/interleukin-1 receptor domain-containing protein [Phycisphaeraceae bacterium]|nr:toll/interleukin-1 receptor domain-containing protein [Phycisphaeraceae bacterium]